MLIRLVNLSICQDLNITPAHNLFLLRLTKINLINNTYLHLGSPAILLPTNDASLKPKSPSQGALNKAEEVPL